MPIKQARRDQKIEEIDITICNILPLLKRENEHVHKDMSEAYPKLDANEVSRGRKLQAIGDYAVVYEMTKISPSGAESDGRDDLSCMTNVNLNEGQYVLKTLQARAILMGEYEQINEWRNIYLETEIRLLSNIRHPNIINLKATSLELNSFLILERLYDSLTEKIYEWREFEHKARAMFRKKKIDKLHEKKMLVAYDVISAISHLHKHNIIHRDIKPDNFAFDSEENVKLCNFSQAREIPIHPNKQSRKLHNDHRPEKAFQLTKMVGSPRYMAPEVALGKKYTGYCDIYSFAITFWEMLTYERPFEKYPTIRQMKKNVWDSTSQARPNLDNDLIPDPLRIMLRKAWSENVVLRPKLLEVKNFLRNEMRGQPMPKKIVEWMSTDNECPFCQKNRTNLVKGELRLLQEPIETTPASFFIR